MKTKPFSELRKQMTPERRAENETRARLTLLHLDVAESLTEVQWQIAHAIAQTLVKADTDVNELGKAIAYLRTYANQENAGAKFLEYLKILVRNGRQIGHSKRTTDYYENIENACSQYLKAYQDDAHVMLKILG